MCAHQGTHTHKTGPKYDDGTKLLPRLVVLAELLTSISLQLMFFIVLLITERSRTSVALLSEVSISLLAELGSDLVSLKIAQLTSLKNCGEGYVYYCGLCDEALILARRMINPRKVCLTFNDACPGCGFRLGSVLRCEASRIPIGIDLLNHPKCMGAKHLIDKCDKAEPSFTTAMAILRGSMFKLTTGIDALDRALELGIGQLVLFEGKASHAFSSLLCVRAVLPKPIGLDSDVVFIDGANVFDAYLISEHSIKHQVDPEEVLKRIHVSRAFTYHQLSTLITEKLPHAIDEFKAKLVVVSDITQLYCDPDIQDKHEALGVFRENMRTLAMMAKRKSVLIVATNHQTRNKRMDDILLHTARVAARLEDKDTFMRLTLHKHPFTPQLEAAISPNKQTLESYL